ncbi:MAG TPA: zinc-binding dehydrogenase [Gaiellaceae bacterium]|nr:zinc-binding dehydrogenase [Gaiellaceae bacterium]
MRAVLLRRTGGPEQLVLEEVPEPRAGEGEAVVEVRAAGVNFADVLVRLGRYPQMPELPVVLGSEVAGEVDGRRVVGFTSGYGGYAERAAAARRWLFPLPAGASFAEGAAFLTAFVTAWVPLTQLARVGFGARVLVTAAAGGVGSAAVQLVRVLNGVPVAAVGGRDKLALPRGLGAREAVTYDELGELEQVHVVLDLVGGDVFSACLPLVRPLGALIAVGFAGGLWPDVRPARLVGRNVGLQGFDLGRLMRHAPEVVEQAARDVLRLWEAGAVRPVVGGEYPLAEAGEAHRALEERRSQGNLVLLT